MPPACRANPTAQYASIAIPYTMKFIANVCAAFLERVKPVSTIANPACMNITRKPATSVQTKLIATVLAAAAAFAARASESGVTAAGAAGIPCATRASGNANANSAPIPTERFMAAPGQETRLQTVMLRVNKLQRKRENAQYPIRGYYRMLIYNCKICTCYVKVLH